MFEEIMAENFFNLTKTLNSDVLEVQPRPNERIMKNMSQILSI